MTITTEPKCQTPIRVANVTKGESGDTDNPGTSFMGGKPRSHWIKMAEGYPHDGGTPKDYYPKSGTDLRHTHPYDIDYKEDSSREYTHATFVRPGGRGSTSDMTVSQGAWDKGCVETEGGQEVVLSYSDGSVKDSGTIESGAWHFKRCSLT